MKETCQGPYATWLPFAVDLSSGVETNGVKDLEKMRTAVRLARAEI